MDEFAKNVELAMRQLNLIYCVREGLITWFEFFERWRALCGTDISDTFMGTIGKAYEKSPFRK